MNDLIKITKSNIGAEVINSVNAREIHSYLQVNTKFADWIRRAIEKYDFKENVDYVCFLKNEKAGNNAISKDYIVTLDMAKELAMLENNEKGKETRRYFIEVEKKQNKPLTYEEVMQNALLLADEKVKALEHKIEIEKPLTDFGRAISQSVASVSVGAFAKSIESDLKVKFGRNTCFEWLRENGYLMSSNSNKNQPYQKWINEGIFEVTQGLRQNSTFQTIDITTLITGKGQEHLFNKIKSSLNSKDK